MEKPAASSSSSSASSVEIHQDSAPTSPTKKMSSCTTITTTAKPTWLLSNLADVEERMKMLALNSNSKTPQNEDTGDTFAQRAEAYYKTRPQLLSLLQDLYNSYLTLSDRYIQTIAKSTSLSLSFHPPRRQSSQASTVEYYDYYELQDQYETSLNDSDGESSLSSHHHLTYLLAQGDDCDAATTMPFDLDATIAEIVTKNVECDILLHLVNASERQHSESSRKIELQKSLLEVLESERLILLNENAKLGYRVGALVEENKALASESLFMRRKAGELARCLLQMREDRRVSMLSRKIEDLQGQIYGLEKRNKEYYQQLVNNEDHSPQGSLEWKKSSSLHKKKNRGRNSNEVDLHVCFQIGKMKRRGGAGTRGTAADKKGFSWWRKVKNMDMFLCGLNSTPAA